MVMRNPVLGVPFFKEIRKQKKFDNYVDVEVLVDLKLQSICQRFPSSFSHFHVFLRPVRHLIELIQLALLPLEVL